MKRRKKFTDQCIKELEEIPILQIAKDLGLSSKRAGRDYKIPGFGGLTINPIKNCWHCFTLNEKIPRGPIGFIEFMTGTGFIESVKILADMYNITLETQYEDNIQTTQKVQNKVSKIPKFKIEPEKKELVLPNKSATFRHVFAYLCKTRKIDRRVIEYFIKTNRLYENDMHSCVFVGLDPEGNPKHCAIRGTLTYRVFKGEAEGSNKMYSFSKPGDSKTLHVFESPIDLMSYLSLHSKEWEDHHLALCCLADVALVEYLKNYQINSIFLHFDNDKWGEKNTQEYIEKYRENYRVWDHRPPKEYKDWNEYLVEIKK